MFRTEIALTRCFDLLRVLPEVNAVHGGGVAWCVRSLSHSPRSGVDVPIKRTTRLQFKIDKEE
jgi:hypothetical protein